MKYTNKNICIHQTRYAANRAPTLRRFLLETRTQENNVISQYKTKCNDENNYSRRQTENKSKTNHYREPKICKNNIITITASSVVQTVMKKNKKKKENRRPLLIQKSSKHNVRKIGNRKPSSA